MIKELRNHVAEMKNRHADIITKMKELRIEAETVNDERIQLESLVDKLESEENKNVDKK